MEEKDITLADMILASLMSESEHIMLYVIHEKATDEAQAQRVILSLCSYGAAHETDIHLEKTDKTANLIALGGARYIYEQECLKKILRTQIATSSLTSQNASSNWGGRRYPPFAFTEMGGCNAFERVAQ